MFVAAVTGTDGKTSVASFTRQIWEYAGCRAASLGTLGIESPLGTRPKPMMNASMGAFPRLVEQLRESDRVSSVIFEAMSNSLADCLYDAMEVDVAAFTTISPEHLDVHGSYRSYSRAKKRLFTHVLKSWGTAVVNTNTGFGLELESVCQSRGIAVLSYGPEGTLKLRETAPHRDGTDARISGLGQDLQVVVPVVGHFMVMNALAAAGVALASGVSRQAIREALPLLNAPPGRMQPIATVRGAVVYLDYAHTPGALRAALSALRRRCSRELIVVFGCGGDRDPSKRPVMGWLASRLADRIIVTDDNPRSELPAAIRASIKQGCPGADEVFPRRLAIESAVESLRPGDVLLIAGRGPESVQLVADKQISGSDAKWIHSAVAPGISHTKTT